MGNDKDKDKDSKVVEIGAGALAVYKRRQDRDGKIVAYPLESPLIKATKAEGTVVDLDWLDRTLTAFPDVLLPLLFKVAGILASRERNGCTEVNIASATYRTLMVLERKGILEQLNTVVLPELGNLAPGTIDVFWLMDTLETLSDRAFQLLGDAAQVDAEQQPGGATDANLAVALYKLLKRAEADDTLQGFQRGSPGESPQ